MKDRGRNILALTVPTTFVLILVGASWRDRTLDPPVAGGLVAILASIVALYATRDKDED